jgi:hypothetical protein
MKCRAEVEQNDRKSKRRVEWQKVMKQSRIIEREKEEQNDRTSWRRTKWENEMM